MYQRFIVVSKLQDDVAATSLRCICDAANVEVIFARVSVDVHRRLDGRPGQDCCRYLRCALVDFDLV